MLSILIEFIYFNPNQEHSLILRMKHSEGCQKHRIQKQNWKNKKVKDIFSQTINLYEKYVIDSKFFKSV